MTITSGSLLSPSVTQGEKPAAYRPADVARLAEVASRPSLEDLHAAVAEMAAVQRQINTLGGHLLLAVERARRIAVCLEDEVLAADSPRLRELDPGRAADLARRALVEETKSALGVGPRTAQGLLADAELLTGAAPATLAAVLAGDLSERHARAFADEVADLSPGEVAAVERTVLPGAATRSLPDFRRRVRQARDLIQPVPLEVRHADAAARRGVWVDPAPDGMATLTALLTTTAAHAIHDRLTQTGQAAGADGDPRTLAQLRADTLTDLLLDDGTLDRFGAAMATGPVVPDRGPAPDAVDGGRTGGGAVGGGVAGELTAVEARTPAVETAPEDPPPFRPGDTDSPSFLARLARTVRPHVQVTVPVTTLLGGSAPGCLDGHSPVDPDTARTLAAYAPSFKRLLTHPETGAVLSVGRDSYVVPADLREWLRVRDVTCRFPGCGRTAARCDVDHTTGWAAGGATDAGNLAHLCRAHHTLKHQTAWHVRHTGGGMLDWTSPAGHRYTTVPGSAVVHTVSLTGAAPTDVLPDPLPEQGLGDPPF